jgi:hypothetical protein
MFGQSKPVVFERYGRRRSSWRLPRWLVLLLVGTAIGAGGLYFVQERYLPPRLSADESTKLRSEFEQADAERARLQAQLGTTTQQLEAALADKKRQDAELAAPRAAAQRLQDELGAVIGALPPDPRGGAVEVRAGRFTAQRGAMAYDVVLTRERDTAQALAGVMQFSVAGTTARGSEATLELKPVAVSIGSHQIVRGSLPLPEGFKPRQTTVQVLDSPGGKPLGMRVMLVR